MTRKIDLTGQRFGRLVVLEPAQTASRGTAWRCQCDCGNFKDVKTNHLRAGRILSCGCLNKEKRKSRFKDMTGFENENFKVLEKVESYNQRARWLCECKHCGNTTILNSNEVHVTKSCGCLKRGATAEYMAKIMDIESLKSIKPTKKSTTGVRGVYRQNKRGVIRYQACINVDKKTKYLGTFSTIEEAAKVRRAAEKKYWGK